MPNRVYITRADHWENGDESPIEASEWRQFVRDNSEFQFVDSETGRARWRLHPYGKPVVFELHEGNVVTDDPDVYASSTFRFIAHQLDAEVQGNRGKPYF